MGPEYHTRTTILSATLPGNGYGGVCPSVGGLYGQGRTVAFTDSTIFPTSARFSGQSELMLGMVEWLNHGNPPVNPRPWLVLLDCCPWRPIVDGFPSPLALWERGRG